MKKQASGHRATTDMQALLIGYNTNQLKVYPDQEVVVIVHPVGMNKGNRKKQYIIK